MRLLVHELVANSGVGSLLQWISTKSKKEHLTHVRPHLLKFGAPAGALTVQLVDEDGNVLTTSESVDIDDISSADYFHGYVRFEIEYVLEAETRYGLLLQSSGYSFSESAYIGWCADRDLAKYEKQFSAQADEDYPLDVENWTRQKRVKGHY